MHRMSDKSLFGIIKMCAEVHTGQIVRRVCIKARTYITVSALCWFEIQPLTNHATTALLTWSRCALKLKTESIVSCVFCCVGAVVLIVCGFGCSLEKSDPKMAQTVRQATKIQPYREIQ